MADIKQAAKWMQEGKRVRRKGWLEEELYLYLPEGDDEAWAEHPSYHYTADYTMQDLLADDWEIAE